MNGIGVSPGIAIGRAYLLRQQEQQVSGLLLADAEAVGQEIESYRTAVAEVTAALVTMMAGLEQQEASILEVQVELLQDPAWEDAVLEKINDRLPARDAVLLATEQLAQLFLEMEDAYLQARSADLKDLGRRVFRQLTGEVGTAMPAGDDWIVVAEDLSPSDTMALDTSRVAGFVTRVGGKTSHAAIVARLRGLPAVVGVGAPLETIVAGDELVLDGTAGLVLVNPDEAGKATYRQRREAFLQRQRLLQSLKNREAVTRDGVRVHLHANIATAEDMEQALSYGAEG